MSAFKIKPLDWQKNIFDPRKYVIYLLRQLRKYLKEKPVKLDKQMKVQSGQVVLI